MPARNLHRVDEEGAYCHIYNKGIGNTPTFGDEADYQVFLGYLEEYLSPPKTLESTKKDFTVNGRVFRGVPHQPKNYVNKVELFAYNLKPNHFHLILHQKTRKSLQGLIRSLCTRYSMYFNKKYDRTGPLFEGPYKSVTVKDETSLLLLTRHLHKAGGYSSYPVYSGQKVTPWVKTKTVLSIKNSEGDYKDFIEKNTLNQKEEELLKTVVLEHQLCHLERRIPEEIRLKKPLSRIPELIGASTLFVLLLGFSFRNITTTAKSPIATSTILGTTNIISAPQVPTASPQPKIMLAVKYTDEKLAVNIRQEPAVESKIIGQAHNGDKFEFVSEDSGWSQIKLPDGSIGFILSSLVETTGEPNS
jgi:REP element-mobilizing transposase RayT